MWDTIKFFLQYELLDFFKTSIVGDAALGAMFVSWILTKYRNLPRPWRERAEGAGFAFLLIAAVAAGQFFYIRWTTDPRMVPADEIESFKATLPPYDASQLVTVFC
ncbi:MAG: hypothetical protein WAU82_19790, partial [Candidatus Binatus sp.]|uniref:hypothetical protein n=1 Tax=Candidatus Binatus sp. TaxID=2811406 RepID=UPI003BB1F710